ncbi:hypothetical protein SNEBB_006904 [Seison nebaliae]|nr:hypothetical protein SNEBB_006904 [Seison nebaliae]
MTQTSDSIYEGKMEGEEKNEQIVDQLEAIDQSLWVLDLEERLLKGCDYGSLRNITKCRTIPDHLRTQVWKLCLQIESEKDEKLEEWDEVLDLKEQNLVHKECIDVLKRCESDSEDNIQRLENLVTYYCKVNGECYEKDCGWCDIMGVLLLLDLTDKQIYEMFGAIQRKYIPKDCVMNGIPFHLFRLLLLYHDPKLCGFLDTKKIYLDHFGHQWLKRLLAGCCTTQCLFAIWDIIFQHGDSFLLFFFSLVLILNCRDAILDQELSERVDIVKFMSDISRPLVETDINDLYQLALYYESKTPQSFRKEFSDILFGDNYKMLEIAGSTIYQSLCLPINVMEIVHANQLGQSTCRYFVVDCRPSAQYNNGHLSTAFHLDASLMMTNPKAFAEAVDLLFDAQAQAIKAESVAAGEHLCFMGSGFLDEDVSIYMVVAYFLNKHVQYVGIAYGGYTELMKYCHDDLDSLLIRGNELNDNHQISSSLTTTNTTITTSTSSAMNNGEKDKSNEPVKQSKTSTLISMLTMKKKEFQDLIGVNKTHHMERSTTDSSSAYRDTDRGIFSLEHNDEDEDDNNPNKHVTDSKEKLSVSVKPLPKKQTLGERRWAMLYNTMLPIYRNIERTINSTGVMSYVQRIFSSSVEKNLQTTFDYLNLKQSNEGIFASNLIIENEIEKKNFIAAFLCLHSTVATGKYIPSLLILKKDRYTIYHETIDSFNSISLPLFESDKKSELHQKQFYYDQDKPPEDIPILMRNMQVYQWAEYGYQTVQQITSRRTQPELIRLQMHIDYYNQKKPCATLITSCRQRLNVHSNIIYVVNELLYIWNAGEATHLIKRESYQSDQKQS